MNAPPKNPQAASQPAITAVRVWENVNHTNMCRAHDGGEDQRVHPPTSAGLGVTEQAELGEVELALHPRFAVDDPNRGGTDPESAPLHGEPVQRAVGHQHAAAGQQLLDLHQRQRVMLLPVDLDAATQPRICSSWPSRVSHDAPCPFGRTGRTASTTSPTSSSVTASGPASRDNPAASRGGDVAAGGLAVHPRSARDRPQPVAFQPRPQHLTHLDHTDLPETHPR